MNRLNHKAGLQRCEWARLLTPGKIFYLDCAFESTGDVKMGDREKVLDAFLSSLGGLAQITRCSLDLSPSFPNHGLSVWSQT